jgi:hypothetical protein
MDLCGSSDDNEVVEAIGLGVDVAAGRCFGFEDVDVST